MSEMHINKLVIHMDLRGGELLYCGLNLHEACLRDFYNPNPMKRNYLMKRILMLSTALAIGALTAQAELASGVNVLTNPGFEDVTTSPWAAQGAATFSINTSTVQTGAQSMQVDHTDAGSSQGIQQVFSIDSADALQEYTISASINHNGQSQMIGYRVALWEFGPSGTIFHDSDWVWVAPGTTGWQDYSMTTELTNADSDSLWAVVYCAPQGGQAGTIFVDDVSLVKTPPLPSNVNLLENPGYEDVTTAPWFGETTTISISNTSQTGAQSLLVDFPGQDFVGIGQNLPIGPADRLEEFTATCSVNNDSHSEVIGYKIGIWENSPTSGWTFNESDYIWVGAGTSDWVDLSYTVTLTDPDATFVRARISIFPQGSPKAAGHFLVDDFVVSKGQISLPSGVNLLDNPGYEEVSISPWVQQGGAGAIALSNASQTGAQAAAVDFPAGAYNGIAQDVAILEIDQNQEYKVSCSVNSQGFGHLLGYKIGVWEMNAVGGGALEFHEADYFWTQPSASDWVDLSHTVTLTNPATQALRVVVWVVPNGNVAAGQFLIDDWSLVKTVDVTAFPGIADNSELLVNGGFTQVENENPVGGVLGNWYTVDGSLSDWSGFWGSSATLTGWAHYHEDPNNLGALIGNVNSGPDAGFDLDGTDKLNTDFNTVEGILNLNSSGSYRNGMRQALDGLTIDTSLTYVLSIVAKKKDTHDHSSASFNYALTTGADEATAINFANVVPGTAVQHISSGALPTDFGAPVVLYVSGADLQAADTAGTVNVIMQNLNTEVANNTPTDPDNVSQVTISSVSLAYSIPNGDVNKDGAVDNDDVILANSYLDGSVDGGDDAATRLAAEIANDNTAAEAMALLNLTDFDTDGDGTFAAADVTLIDDLATALAGAGDPISSDAGFNVGDEFEIVVDGLVENNTYYLKRTADLTDGYIIIDSVEAAATTETFTDTAPLADKAFYQVTD